MQCSFVSFVVGEIPGLLKCQLKAEKMSAVKQLKLFNTQMKPVPLEPWRAYDGTSKDFIALSTIKIIPLALILQLLEHQKGMKQTETENCSLFFTLSPRSTAEQRKKNVFFLKTTPETDTSEWWWVLALEKTPLMYVISF